MRPISGLVRPRLIVLGGNELTDHNRSPLDVSVERIETRQRMANGTMRKYFVADKRSFSVSWENVPNVTGATVDGKQGGAVIEALYNQATGPLTLVVYGRSATEFGTFTVVFNEFSKNIVKRWKDYELWNVSISLEEV